MNGSEQERELARHLDGCRYHVIRSPASGSATQRELPDLFWAKDDERPIASELKTTSQNVAYYDQSEVSALIRFAQAFCARPMLCARFAQDTTFYLCEPEAARLTESNNYAVDREIEPMETIKP